MPKDKLIPGITYEWTKEIEIYCSSDGELWLRKKPYASPFCYINISGRINVDASCFEYKEAEKI